MKAVVIGEPSGASMEAIMAVYPRHKAVVDTFIAMGEVVGIGPFSDRGNMAIFRTRAAAERFVKEDPFVLEGLVKSYTVRDWHDDMMGMPALLTAAHPKLPMRNKAATKAYYVDQLGFTLAGSDAHADYLMVARDGVQLHFFLHPELDPTTNYGQVYLRTGTIDALYGSLLEKGVRIHPNSPLATKPWGQREFALLDPDHNLLTFGQAV